VGGGGGGLIINTLESNRTILSAKSWDG